MKKNLNFLILIIFLIFLYACQKPEQPKPSEDIWIGMTKTEIVKLVGETNEKRYISKTNNQIQGPEKEFWHEIPMGAKLEVWTYNTAQGQLKLYFIGKSSELKFKILLK
jgi:hypothetical protein